VTAARSCVFEQRCVEESPDTAGQDAPAREAAKADGKWNREQTADRSSVGKGETVG
jgi:hypothetical protein